jgi:hypothetical protein
MLTYGVVLLRDRSFPHRAARTRALLENFNWELFDHPPYSHDLVPRDHHLSVYLKNLARSQGFNNNEELMEDVNIMLSSHVADFFDRGMQKYIPRYKCLNSVGDGKDFLYML